MHVQFQNYNYIKSYTQWVQQPWKRYTAKLHKNWFWGAIAPLMLPVWSLALVGRLSCTVLAWCNPKVRSTAATVIKTAFIKTRLHPRTPPPGTIRNGNGEYLVLKKEQGSLRPLTKEEYGSVYDVMQSSHLWTSAHYGLSVEERKTIAKDPYTYLSQRVKRIDPSFEVAFVPSVIYEMFYLEKAFMEQVDYMVRNKFTQFIYHFSQDNVTNNEEFASPKDMPFNSPFYKPKATTASSQLAATVGQPGLIDLHYQMNTGLINAIFQAQLDPTALTFERLKHIADRQITTFKSFALGSSSPIAQKISTFNYDKDSLYTFLHLPRYLAFTNPKVESIIKNVLRHECSRLAQTHAFFYRGAERKMDRAVSLSVYGGSDLSLGATLFAGIMRDTGACAIAYMSAREGLVYPVKKEELLKANPPVRFLPSSTILQLNGIGEYFHARYDVDRTSKAALGASCKAFDLLRRQVIFIDKL